MLMLLGLQASPPSRLCSVACDSVSLSPDTLRPWLLLFSLFSLLLPALPMNENCLLPLWGGTGEVEGDREDALEGERGSSCCVCGELGACVCGEPGP